MRTTVNKGGYARTVNVIEEAKKFSEIMADSSHYQRIEPYQRDLASPSLAEQVIQEAIANVPENERERIEQWWPSARENVAKQWEYNQQKSGSYLGTSSINFSSFFTDKHIFTDKHKIK